VLERHSHYASEENLRPPGIGDLFTTAWTRQALDAIVKKGHIHLTEVQSILPALPSYILLILGSETLGFSERLGAGSFGSNLRFGKVSHSGIDLAPIAQFNVDHYWWSMFKISSINDLNRFTQVGSFSSSLDDG
jgi:hypothetical protein